MVLEAFPAEFAHARPGRDELPVVVSRPPHILCDAARRFAVYSDEFIVVGARQPAIAGPKEQSDFLKALSLYLSSDFAQYHQYLMSPQWGVFSSCRCSTTLRAIPVPLAKYECKADLRVARPSLSACGAPLGALAKAGPSRARNGQRSESEFPVDDVQVR